jgi:hypothetical protein
MTLSNKKIKSLLPEVENALIKEIIIRIIKISDIFFITFLYGIFGMMAALTLDKYVFKYISFQEKENKYKTFLVLFSEILLSLTIIGIVAYFLRNILQMVPFPLDGIYGFSHLRVNEVRSGAIIGTILMYFSKTLRAKIAEMQNKL